MLMNFEGIKYYSKERMELLLSWIFTINSIDILNKNDNNSSTKAASKNSTV